MQTLKPSSYIKMNQKNQKYQCSICNHITEKPYRCKGMCQKYYCFQCYSNVKSNMSKTDRCPFRCSEPFECTEYKEAQVEFNCPFAPKDCQHPIRSLSQFYSHAEKCKYLPYDWKQKQQNYKNYRCLKGHDLFYPDKYDKRKLFGGWNYYQIITNLSCASCQFRGLCISICPQCSGNYQLVVYCPTCRPTPCIQKICPKGIHELKHKINHSKFYICNCCGQLAFLKSQNVFQDDYCDFGICQQCYYTLPQTHVKVPFTMPRSAISHLYFNPQVFQGYSNSQQEDEEQQAPYNADNVQ